MCVCVRAIVLKAVGNLQKSANRSSIKCRPCRTEPNAARFWLVYVVWVSLAHCNIETMCIMPATFVSVSLSPNYATRNIVDVMSRLADHNSHRAHCSHHLSVCGFTQPKHPRALLSFGWAVQYTSAQHGIFYAVLLVIEKSCDSSRT